MCKQLPCLFCSILWKWKDSIWAIIATTSIVLLQIYGFSATNARKECVSGCEPWSWVWYDFTIVIFLTSVLIAITSLLDSIAQCCELGHRRSQRQKSERNIASTSFSELQSTRNTCDRIKDSFHNGCICVSDRHHDVSKWTWWMRVLLCMGQFCYIVLFILHTRSSEISSNDSLIGSSTIESINDIRVLYVTSKWPYYVYLTVDLFFALWLILQLVSIRSHSAYNTKLFQNNAFVLGWLGTMSSMVMCGRRLILQNNVGANTPPFSIGFLRVLYVEKLLRELLLGSKTSGSNNSGVGILDDFKKQMITTLLGTLSFMFVASTAFYTFEGLGDPPMLKASFRTNDWINEWHIFGAMYWSVVTMTTVGYGDMYPNTQLGKIFAIIIIIVGIQFLAQILDKLSEYRSSQRKGSGRYIPSRSSRSHVVICGRINRSVIREVLAQLFNESIKKVWDVDIGGLEAVVMVPKDCYDIDTQRWLKSNWLYDARVKYLSGDVFNDLDANRASLGNAKACFLFPENNGGDDDTVIRATRTQQLFGSKLALFVMLHSARLKPQLLHARIPKHRVLCLDEIKFKLAAAAASVPGSTNLLLNLLSFSTIKESRERLFGPRNKKTAVVNSNNSNANDGDDEEEENDENSVTTTHSSFFKSVRNLRNTLRTRSRSTMNNTKNHLVLDQGLELHAMGATQQFIEFQTPVGSILNGKLFYKVAKDIYLEKWNNKNKNQNSEEDVSENDGESGEESGEEGESESDLNGEEEKIEKERRTKRKSIRAKLRRGESLPSSSSSSSSNSSSSDSDSDYESDSNNNTTTNNNNNNNNNDSKNNSNKSKSNDVIEDEDQTPMLLVGLQTMQEKGRGGRVQRTKIELAPPRVTSYKLRIGDRLFFVADDIEEVNNKMTQLLQWYTYQTNNASAETETASETKENSNASTSILSSSSIIQSTGSLRKSFERFDSRGVKKQDAILHEMDASSYQNHGARSSTDSDTDSDDLTEEQLLNRRHANDPNTALLDFDVLHQRPKGSKNHLLSNTAGKEKWRKDLLKDWLGSDVEEYLEDGNVNPEYVTPSRTAYVRSIMYPSIEVPVTIEKIANDANHSITCHQQTDAFVKWLENDSFGNNEHSEVKHRIHDLSKRLSSNWSLKEKVLQARLGHTSAVEQCRIRPLPPKKIKTEITTSNNKNENNLNIIEGDEESKSNKINNKKNKTKYREKTKDGREVLQLDHMPMSRCEAICRFNLQTPGGDQLTDHVVVCHCNVAANGHHVVRYFTERGISKICFLTETPPRFEVWGDIVTQTPDCQVYFVTGEITDVTVLKNANVGQARAVILLFPEEGIGNKSSKRSDEYFSNQNNGDGSDTTLSNTKESKKEGLEKTQQALDQRQEFATSLVENNFVLNGINPPLGMTLITEMSRGASITGKFNQREAMGRLFSHLDFVSLLAVRYHFRHFLGLAYQAIEQIKLVEVPANTVRRKLSKKERKIRKAMNKKRRKKKKNKKMKTGIVDDDKYKNGSTYGEALVTLLDKGMILVGLLRYLRHPNDGTVDAGALYPCVLTNPPRDTELRKGDHCYYFATEVEEVVEEKEEVNGNNGNGNGNVEKKKRKRKVKRKLSRHASSVTNRKNPFTPTMLYYAGKIATQNKRKNGGSKVGKKKLNRTDKKISSSMKIKVKKGMSISGISSLMKLKKGMSISGSVGRMRGASMG